MCWRIVLLDKQTRKELISALRLHMDSNLQDLPCLSVTDESSGEEIKETTSSTRSESVTIKRKIRSKEESTEDDCISSDAYGNDHGEKRVKQSTQKKLNAKVSSKTSEQKSLAKTGKQKLRLKEEEASLTVSSKVLRTD
ncbi:hypothetical protein Bca101_029080 [Brassica carinata]